MIYTVTLNPSIDYVLNVQEFQAGRTNRAVQGAYIAGGKGINVSRMLKNLGVSSVALGFVAGNTGEMFLNIIRDYGLEAEFVRLAKGETRINVKLKAQEETEINAKGPFVSGREMEMLLEKVSGLQTGDVLVLAGSVPPGLDDGCYAEMIELVSKNGVQVIVDTTGERLKRTLPCHPLLVKPNIAELGELFGVEIAGRKEAVAYAGRLISLGARNVIVSMEEKGAVLVNENGKSCYVPAVRGRVINSVGAGDSMVAGFLHARSNDGTAEECLKLAVACGCASTFSCEFGTKEEVESIYSLLTLQ